MNEWMRSVGLSNGPENVFDFVNVQVNLICDVCVCVYVFIIPYSGWVYGPGFWGFLSIFDCIPWLIQCDVYFNPSVYSIVSLV